MGVLSSGVVLSGRYRLDDRVATGGMGDVWRATDLVLGRQVAVKVLLPALVSDPDFIARFRAEARIMASLRHPGVVQVFDCGEDELPDGGRADYLVMEFVEGEPLSRRIQEAGHLEVAETMSIVAQVAQALQAAHARGIVHRDVKPSNLLVQQDGAVVLVDFGVARSTNVTSITSTNAVPGTALYMAPEQAAGRPVSGATDIYALGAVAYCCLTGSPPFTGDNPLQVAVRHLDDEPPELPADIPQPVRDLVARALAKDPADRYPDGAAMAAAARAAMAGAPTAMVPVALRGAVGPATRDDPTLAAPLAMVAPAGRRGRRGTLVGALAAVLVALTALGAALGAARDVRDPATTIETTPTAVTHSDDAESTAATETPADQGGRTRRPSRPDTRRSVTATPTPTPSGSVEASPSEVPSTPPTPPSTPPSTTPPTDNSTPPTDTTTTPPEGGQPPAAGN
ncbi:serine/threonine protein kinase [Micromonospora sp. DR5-3]|uniref:serine/threonine-protein kinase n=1 Tax=unclassified Micromonospora TaxID=2617518 RepID=UPI0011D33393|nr:MULTISPECIES: serine/threonine-protein kinase [unclassified Micromonospora]MCW3815141.1 serine/threonine protein kinase [Micromonospora sp. DR5-3]TYC22022.1 serine/threonine protein kinase [Micromonospora sp. MP36]